MLSVNETSKALDNAAAAPEAKRYVLVPVRRMPKRVRWSFLLLAFTLPLQAADLAFLNGSLSLAKISGLLFFLFFVLHYKPFLYRNSLPTPPKVIWWFAAYLLVYIFHGFFIPGQFFGAFLSRFITLLQVIVLFWCAANLFEDETLVRQFLFAFAIGALIFALGVLLQLPGFAVTESIDERVTALGNDPNAVAQLMAIAAVILLGLFLHTAFKHFANKVLCALLILPFVVVMVQTGSRGGVLAFMTGCFVYSVPFWNSRKRWSAVALGVICVGAVVSMIITNPSFSERVHESVYGGDLGHREEIYPVAEEMFLERPVFGWHPIEMWYDLNDRVGWRAPRDFTDTHNLLLHLLLEGGIVGAFPFLMGLGVCIRAAWRSRSGSLGLCPLALIGAVLVANMSTTGIYDKHLWVFLALTVAVESRWRRPRRQIAVLVRPGRPSQVK
jgi:O-antigen ligase